MRTRSGALISLLAVTATGLAVAGTAAPRDEKPRDLAPLLQPIRLSNDLPALAGAIVEGDRVVAIGADGVRRRGTSATVTVDDQWHIGSDTKAMTATLIATLVRDGKLQWSTTIGEVFGKLVPKMDPGWRGVTLTQLLTHRAGAPENLDAGGLWQRLWEQHGTAVQQRMELVHGVLESPPAYPPGSRYAYSNAGYAIAGAMAETVEGRPYEALMRRRLFEPLGMASAGFGAPGTPGQLLQPLGHKEDGTPVGVGPAADNPPAITPAGRVHCSLRDWARFVSLHLRGACQDAHLIDAAAFKMLQTPPPGADPPYAMGWLVEPRDWAGGLTLDHAGSNTMWFAVVWIAPRKDFAVLVTTNQGGDKAAKAADAAAWSLIQDELRHQPSHSPPSPGQ